MGFYIKPADGDKAKWLIDNSVQWQYHTPVGEAHYIPETDLIQVCAVQNPGFIALGICYNQAELTAFSRPDDPRGKLWGLVPATAVLEFLHGQEIEGRSV